MLDLNRLRDQLGKSEPVRVTRTGRLETVDGREKSAVDAEGPSIIKRHTFADATRLGRECAALEANTRAVRQPSTDGSVVYQETIETDFGVPFTFRMVVPPAFPLVAPKVYCLEPEVPKTRYYHIWGEGHLCLFQPAEWNSTVTLMDVRNWACEWAFNVVPMLYGATGFMSPEHG